MPAVQAATSQGRETASAAEAPRDASLPPVETSILVVDDVGDKLVAMRAILEGLAQNVVTVTSGREALRRLLNEDFAVILLDVNMPELDGFETAALIRQRPRSEDTPIIFVTAFGDDYAHQGYQLGAVDFIQTPVVPEVLRAKVRVFVDLYCKKEQLKRQAEQRASLVALAERRASQLKAMSTELVHTEQRERRRLAQTLHDHIQQLLVAAKMRVSRARNRVRDDDLEKQLREVDSLLEQSIGSSRSLAIELSPPILNEAGLVAALEWLARWMRETHALNVTVVSAVENQRLSDEIRITLFQAIRELLFNVVKHSRVDTAEIRLSLSGERWLRASVVDKGVGFDPAVVKEQVSAESLGLFSIRERLETLGGQFDVESRPGQGTCISLIAPIGEVPADDALADETPVEAPLITTRRSTASPSSGTPSSGTGRIRVLLVDDHTILRQGLKGLLLDEPDIEVVGEAADGRQAVIEAAALLPDVIIMDINMPEMNGIEATRAIKQEHASIQIIGLSLHEDQEVANSMFAAGATAYLTKGGPSEELCRAIRSVRCAVETR